MNSKETSAYWTDERVNRLKELWALGWSSSRIARDLGQASRSAITGKIYRLGLPRRRDGASATKVTRVPAAKPRVRPAFVPPAPKFVAPAKERGPAVSRDRAFAPLPGFHPVPFLERLPGCCRWPIDGADESEFLCCNRPRDTGHPSYCATHRQLAGQKRPKVAAEAVKDDARRFGRFQLRKAA